MADEIVHIPLTQGYVAVIDAADYPLVSRYSWHVAKRRSVIYAAASLPKAKTLLLHRLLLPDAVGVDHRDRDGLNNRRGNLRATTQGENLANSPARVGRRFKGTEQRPSGTWTARIRAFGQRVQLGTFATEEDAARAYDAVALEVWGDFALLNFPNRT